MRIGIIFGGASREREVSFSGGRTIYDNLDKSLFTPVPVFVDSDNRFILLNWQCLYKGSIRDFYPPVNFLPPSQHGFQVYAESLKHNDFDAMTREIGTPLSPQDFSKHFDFAFLALHGAFGEDGTIQGLLEWQGIPYSGSGILPSALGMNKLRQKSWMRGAGFNVAKSMGISRQAWLDGNAAQLFRQASQLLGEKMVVKPANQGSSIGITVLYNANEAAFTAALAKAFFTESIELEHWRSFAESEKWKYIDRICDLREGLGMPLLAGDKEVLHPEELWQILDELKSGSILLQAINGETQVIVEEFLEGKEFSCIVIRDENENPLALPPTEIQKGGNLYDYRSKYLPGLSRKITPIHLPEAELQKIRSEAERLFTYFGFHTYARIDGFYTNEGIIYLNDPNTTSGMMPSSFFFHQAAEAGLNPTEFITYIIQTSLRERINNLFNGEKYKPLLATLNDKLKGLNISKAVKKRVAVIMGGYSSERHISVESGRNIYEKLSSSVQYEPIPLFLKGKPGNWSLYRLPINMMLKDNADDIAEKIEHFEDSPVLELIYSETAGIRSLFARNDGRSRSPEQWPIEQLKVSLDAAFIALHGRPGEDGEIQKIFEEMKVPFNGSGSASSSITIDKQRTKEILAAHGFKVAYGQLINRLDWNTRKDEILAQIAKLPGYPLIAKPNDDGCSSAVKKIDSPSELEAFAQFAFRNVGEWPEDSAKVLGLAKNEEFPVKEVFLIESLIDKGDAAHFLEITSGLLTHLNDDGSVRYEMFEASEALARKAVLSLEEKFLAGEGQNITPARYAKNPDENLRIAAFVKNELQKACEILKIAGYARIDAFVKILKDGAIELWIIEVNSLPGMTPATAIFHQCALNGYKPLDFIDKIMEFGMKRSRMA